MRMWPVLCIFVPFVNLSEPVEVQKRIWNASRARNDPQSWVLGLAAQLLAIGAILNIIMIHRSDVRPRDALDRRRVPSVFA
jgi:hypothetical protein